MKNCIRQSRQQQQHIIKNKVLHDYGAKKSTTGIK